MAPSFVFLPPCPPVNCFFSPTKEPKKKLYARSSNRRTIEVRAVTSNSNSRSPLLVFGECDFPATASVPARNPERLCHRRSVHPLRAACRPYRGPLHPGSKRQPFLPV